MALHLENLDPTTREFMMSELDLDLSLGGLYSSKHFTPDGGALYPDFLREAITSGDDTSLERSLNSPGIFKESYEKKTPSGGTTTAKVPHNAATSLAEGEFNRFYLRGLCARLLAEGGGVIEVYRARQSSSPRPASEALIGERFDAAALLEDLRRNPGVDTALGLPGGVNSGLSGQIPD